MLTTQIILPSLTLPFLPLPPLLFRTQFPGFRRPYIESSLLIDSQPGLISPPWLYHPSETAIMAVYSAVPPPPEYTSAPANPPQADTTTTVSLASHVGMTTSATGIDIDAWTVSALQSLSVSPVARGTGTPLAIPIDDHDSPTRTKTVRLATATAATPGLETPRRPPSRRDSQRKREAVLKGKEGSRQRRRWENDRLMHVPNAQPPQPGDWEAHPTHTVHAHVPYQLAQFWDRGVRQRVEDKTTRLAAQRKAQQLKAGSATGLRAGEVPRDLRETAKRTPAVKSWVRALEEPVRQFLQSRVAEDSDDASVDGEAEPEVVDKTSSEDDEEIVFAGRKSGVKTQRQRGGWKKAHRELGNQTVDQGMVFDSFGDDESAAFKYVSCLHMFSTSWPRLLTMALFPGDGSRTPSLITTVWSRPLSS